MRVTAFPSVTSPSVIVQMEVALPEWVEVCKRLGITSRPTASQILEGIFLLVPGYRIGLPGPAHALDRIRAAEDKAERAEALMAEVRSWAELDSVPLGRMVKAIVAAQAMEVPLPPTFRAVPHG